MKKLLSLLSLSIMMLLGCGTKNAVKNWEYTRKPQLEHPVYVKKIPVYIDYEFSGPQIKSMISAANDWNIALNGQIVLEVQNKFFESREEALGYLIQSKKTGSGLVILKSEEEDPLFAELEAEIGTSPVYIRGFDSHLIVLINDRLGNKDLKQLMLQSLGITLGANKVMIPSLMYPVEGTKQFDCIDHLTMIQIADRNNLDLKYLNYCVIP